MPKPKNPNASCGTSLSNPRHQQNNTSSKSIKPTNLCHANNLNLQLCRGDSLSVKPSVRDKENIQKVGMFGDNLARLRRSGKPTRKLQMLLAHNNDDKNMGSSHGSNGHCKDDKLLKSCELRTSLRVCIQLNEPDSKLGRFYAPSTPNLNMLWDESETEAAPAPSWSTLPNRSLLCRPLPPDIGRCTCYIVRERAEKPENTYIYSLYTNEGQGRRDRKLAVARHKRRGGRSEFIVAQSAFGLLSKSNEGYLGNVTANLIGSRYHIWDQGNPLDPSRKASKQLLGVVSFAPTITTLTGSFRTMKACIPKIQSLQMKNTIQHPFGLPKDWEENMSRVHQLSSKVPSYNKESKRYELDFRDKGKLGLKIKASVKNFQLVIEENGRQTILLLGKVGNSKYIMEYRYPMSGYQAFCICLASIDSKLCCSV